MNRTDQSILSVSNISMQFGGICALSDVSFEIKKGTISSLIGPNGAGKTTLFNCITGFYKSRAGDIFLYQQGKSQASENKASENKSINTVELLGQPFSWKDFNNPLKLPRKLFYNFFGGTHLVNRAGIARTFQNIRLFKEMTAIENLLVAQHQHLNRNLLSGMFNTKTYVQSEAQALKSAYQWLEVCGLSDDANKLAGDLPYGHQRQLEIIRAMCTRPRLICLDEPAAGLNPIETRQLGELIRRLRKNYDVTVLLIEHDMKMVMDISDFIVVLDHGEVIARGKPDEIQNNPAVLAAYLGVEA